MLGFFIGLSVAVVVVLVAIGAILYFSGGHTHPLRAVQHRPRGSDTLVIYYSRTGTTARLGDAIAQSLGADVERIEDTLDRNGFMGFMCSLRDAFRHGETTLQPLSVDPAEYELVIVGTPDWGRSMSAPARTFLRTYSGRLHRVAFFLTDGESDHEAIFREMASLAGRQPIATLGIPQTVVAQGGHTERVAAFVRALRGLPRERNEARANSPESVVDAGGALSH